MLDLESSKIFALFWCMNKNAFLGGIGVCKWVKMVGEKRVTVKLGSGGGGVGRGGKWC